MGPTTRGGRGSTQRGFYKHLHGIRSKNTTVRVVKQKNKKQTQDNMSDNSELNKTQLSNDSTQLSSESLQLSNDSLTALGINNNNNNSGLVENKQTAEKGAAVNNVSSSANNSSLTAGLTSEKLKTVSGTDARLLSFSSPQVMDGKENRKPGLGRVTREQEILASLPNLDQINSSTTMAQIAAYKKQIELAKAQSELRELREQVLREHNARGAWRDVSAYNQVKESKYDDHSTQNICQEFNKLGLNDLAQELAKQNQTKYKNDSNRRILENTSSEEISREYSRHVGQGLHGASNGFDPYLLGMKVAKKHVQDAESDSDISECERIIRRRAKQKSVSPPRRHRSTTASSSRSSSTASTDSDYDRRRKRKNKRGKKSKSSGLNKQARSTKVKRHIYWAQEKLSLEMVSHEPKFQNLGVAFLAAGELEAISRRSASQNEVKTRIHILKKLCYHSGNGMPDSQVRELYKAFLSSLEECRISWGDLDSIDRLENQVMLRLLQNTDKSDKTDSTVKTDKARKPGKSNKSSDKSDTIIWCKEYNKGNCTYTGNHEGLFNGEMVQQWHICRVCHSKKGHRLNHRPSEPSCPYYKE